MSDDYDGLRFAKRTEPDDFKDHTAEIIWQMRIGYRRHHCIVEQPPEVKIQQTGNIGSIPSNKRMYLGGAPD